MRELERSQPLEVQDQKAGDPASDAEADGGGVDGGGGDEGEEPDAGVEDDGCIGDGLCGRFGCGGRVLGEAPAEKGEGECGTEDVEGEVQRGFEGREEVESAEEVVVRGAGEEGKGGYVEIWMPFALTHRYSEGTRR